MLGGLARRASLFNTIKQTRKNVIFIAGFYEIANFKHIVPEILLKNLLCIYKKLSYDLKVLSKKDLKFIKKLKIKPQSWTINDNLKIKTFHSPIGNISFIILPTDIKYLHKKEIKEKLKKLKKHSILIGLSPYGYLGEEIVLKKYHYSDIFQLLLGSGRGPFFTYKYVDKQCIWIRPISKGKAIYIITIKQNIKNPKPIPDKNIIIQKKYITQDIPPNPHINAILSQNRCN